MGALDSPICTRVRLLSKKKFEFLLNYLLIRPVQKTGKKGQLTGEVLKVYNLLQPQWSRGQYRLANDKSRELTKVENFWSSQPSRCHAVKIGPEMKSQHRNYSGKMVSHICQGYGKVFIFMHLELLESFRLTSKVSKESWHGSMKNLIIAQEYF